MSNGEPFWLSSNRLRCGRAVWLPWPTMPGCAAKNYALCEATILTQLSGWCVSELRLPKEAESASSPTQQRPANSCERIWRIDEPSQRARGPLFLSESPRNFAQPITLWTWSKVVRQLALQADLPHFSTHTFRHLCLTDLARSGWELHQIAQFAGHRNPATTLFYIHLSGHDLAEQLTRGMSHIHAWRVQTLAHAFDEDRVRPSRQHNRSP